MIIEMLSEKENKPMALNCRGKRRKRGRTKNKLKGQRSSLTGKEK